MVFSHGIHGMLGGAAVSAAPTEQRCTAHRAHLGGYGIPAIPTPPAVIVFSHRWHRCTQMFRLRSIVPRNTQNTQKFSSARKFCEFCGSTFQQEASVCSVNSVGRCSGSLVGAAETAAPPGRVRGYGRDAIPSYNCTDWEGVLKYLCASVISVGEYLSKNFCEFGEFCGKIVWWQRGYGRMPYPPISAPPEEISLSTCLLVNLSTNKKKNYAEQDNTLFA